MYITHHEYCALYYYAHSYSITAVRLYMHVTSLHLHVRFLVVLIGFNDVSALYHTSPILYTVLPCIIQSDCTCMYITPMFRVGIWGRDSTLHVHHTSPLLYTLYYHTQSSVLDPLSLARYKRTRVGKSGRGKRERRSSKTCT